jgi:hypothetical protein
VSTRCAGKTTVASIYGKVLKELGLLSKGEVVVKVPSDFIGSVLGESEKLTAAILDAALGCVLVIDEAYGLYSDKSNDPFRVSSCKQEMHVLSMAWMANAATHGRGLHAVPSFPRIIHLTTQHLIGNQAMARHNTIWRTAQKPSPGTANRTIKPSSTAHMKHLTVRHT